MSAVTLFGPNLVCPRCRSSIGYVVKYLYFELFYSFVFCNMPCSEKECSEGRRAWPPARIVCPRQRSLHGDSRSRWKFAATGSGRRRHDEARSEYYRPPGHPATRGPPVRPAAQRSPLTLWVLSPCLTLARALAVSCGPRHGNNGESAMRGGQSFCGVLLPLAWPTRKKGNKSLLILEQFQSDEIFH